MSLRFGQAQGQLDGAAAHVRMRYCRNMTKAQVNRLGDQLRRGAIGERELRALEEYRRSFDPAHAEIVRLLRSEYELAPTTRSKTSVSIIDKLRREKTRLSTIQDIAGCRIVTSGIAQQEEMLSQVLTVFPKAKIDDRRERPSHGYRAVHVIVEHVGKLVEIQIRTTLQDLWAQVSEKFADVIDHSIKYGGGPSDVRRVLDGSSHEIQELEFLEKQIVFSKIGREPVGLPEDPLVLEKLESNLRQKTSEWSLFFRDIIGRLDNLRPPK